MKKHLLMNGQMYYPVGSDLTRNIPMIKQMAKHIYSTLIAFYNLKNVSLVCRGSSGAIIAGIIAPILFTMGVKDVCIYHVKKIGETSHDRPIPSNFWNSIIVVVDDFICTGETIQAIQKELNELFSPSTKKIDIVCVSGYVSNDCGFDCDHLICAG